jgi:hypothetical protein
MLHRRRNCIRPLTQPHDRHRTTASSLPFTQARRRRCASCTVTTTRYPTRYMTRHTTRHTTRYTTRHTSRYLFRLRFALNGQVPARPRTQPTFRLPQQVAYRHELAPFRHSQVPVRPRTQPMFQFLQRSLRQTFLPQRPIWRLVHLQLILFYWRSSAPLKFCSQRRIFLSRLRRVPLLIVRHFSGEENRRLRSVVTELVRVA